MTRESISRKDALESGDTFYFTGMPCSKGHVSERYVSTHQCVECCKERKKQNVESGESRRYYNENKETILSSSKRYREREKENIARRKKQYAEANKEKIREYKKKYHLEHREEIIAKVKKYTEENKEKIKLRAKQYREKTKARKAEYDKKFDQLNKEYRNHLKAQNRAKRLDRLVLWDEELTTFVSEEAFDLCKKREEITGFKWHVDHVLPMCGKNVSGLHVWNNLAVIPAKENLSKNNTYNVV